MREAETPSYTNPRSSRFRQISAWGATAGCRATLSPGVCHDLGDGNAVNGVRCEQPLEQMLAGIAGAAGHLVLAGHDAREQLLQALQVVAAVVPALCKGQHGCVQAPQSFSTLAAPGSEAGAWRHQWRAAAPGTGRPQCAETAVADACRLLLRSSPRFAKGSMAACRHASHVNPCFLNTELHGQEMAAAIITHSCKMPLACMMLAG